MHLAQTGVLNYGNQTFNGPNAYTTVNSNGLAGGSTQGQPIVFLIGSSVGGQPGTVLRLMNESQARNTLKAGDLLDAYLFARKHGAGEVDVFRVNPAVQATLMLYDSSSNPSILLTTVDYGQYTNSFSASISGTAGALVATLKDAYDNISLTSGTLGTVMTMQYTGNGATANVTITKSLAAVGTVTVNAVTTGGTIPASTAVSVQVLARNASGFSNPNTAASVTTGSGTATNSVTASWSAVTGATSYDVYVGGKYYGNVATNSATITYIPTATAAVPSAGTSGPNMNTTLSGQTDGSVNLDISLASANVTTVSALASFISGQIGYSATVASGAGAVTSSQIDAATAQSLLSAGYNVTAGVASVLNWFNNTGLVTATQPVGATNPPAIVGLTPFTGGSDGTPATQQWQNAANVIATTQPQLRYPVALTSNASYRALINAGVSAAAQLMTTYFSRGFYGGGTSDTDATAEQGAAQLGSDRAYYAHPDFYDYNSQGVYTHFPSYILAACYAGLAAGNNPAQPLTNKVLQINALGGLDTNGNSISESRALALAQAGVSSAYPAADANGNTVIRIYQGISTDLIAGDQMNTYKVEFSVGNQVDQLRIYVAQNMSAAWRGGINYGSSSYGAALADLNGFVSNGVTFGWIAGYTPATEISPAPSNPTFFVSNGVVQVADPINGVLYNISLQHPTGTTTQAAS